MAAVLVLLAAGCGHGPDPAACYREADRLRRSGDLTGALREVRRNRASDVRLRLLEAEILAERGEHRTALDVLRRISEPAVADLKARRLADLADASFWTAADAAGRNTALAYSDRALAAGARDPAVLAFLYLRRAYLKEEFEHT